MKSIRHVLNFRQWSASNYGLHFLSGTVIDFYKGGVSFLNWACVFGIFFSLHETALFALSPPIGNKLLPWENIVRV
jgi:hypothetical protein